MPKVQDRERWLKVAGLVILIIVASTAFQRIWPASPWPPGGPAQRVPELEDVARRLATNVRPDPSDADLDGILEAAAACLFGPRVTDGSTLYDGVRRRPFAGVRVAVLSESRRALLVELAGTTADRIRQVDTLEARFGDRAYFHVAGTSGVVYDRPRFGPAPRHWVPPHSAIITFDGATAPMASCGADP